MGKRWARWCALGGSLVLVVGTAVGSSIAASAASAAPAKTVAASSKSVMPNHTSMMDCNGHSPKYKDVKQDLGGLCTDPNGGLWNGKSYRFDDNGVYVGHDEPSIKFISSAAGSGNNLTYVNRLSTDPQGKPSVSTSDRAARPGPTMRSSARRRGSACRSVTRLVPAEPVHAGQ